MKPIVGRRYKNSSGNIVRVYANTLDCNEDHYEFPFLCICSNDIYEMDSDGRGVIINDGLDLIELLPIDISDFTPTFATVGDIKYHAEFDDKEVEIIPHCDGWVVLVNKKRIHPLDFDDIKTALSFLDQYFDHDPEVERLEREYKETEKRLQQLEKEIKERRNK